MEKPRFKRVLLKISGEAMGAEDKILNAQEITRIAGEIKELSDMGVEVGVVVGGGNIFRGKEAEENGIVEVVGHQMGMLSTLINGLALQNALEKIGAETRLQSAVDVSEFAEPFILRRAIRHLEKGRIVLFGAGTGNPFFTTDSAAALRGIEIQADVLMKATDVDGVYDKDPKEHDDAVMYNEVDYQEAIEQSLRILDKTAFSLAQENHLPIIVFNLHQEGNMMRVATGENVGTRIGLPK
ncbi:UMP kinase [Patescibacteria group bacterium]